MIPQLPHTPNQTKKPAFRVQIVLELWLAHLISPFQHTRRETVGVEARASSVLVACDGVHPEIQQKKPQFQYGLHQAQWYLGYFAREVPRLPTSRYLGYLGPGLLVVFLKEAGLSIVHDELVLDLTASREKGRKKKQTAVRKLTLWRVSFREERKKKPPLEKLTLWRPVFGNGRSDGWCYSVISAKLCIGVEYGAMLSIAHRVAAYPGLALGGAGAQYWASSGRRIAAYPRSVPGSA
eukprot:3941195-Rhodomonas_salina.1